LLQSQLYLRIEDALMSDWNIEKLNWNIEKLIAKDLQLPVFALRGVLKKKALQ